MAQHGTAPVQSAAATAIDGMSNYRSCRMPTRQPRDEWRASGVQRRRAMTGRNLLSACPRAELHGPAGRPVGLCDRPDDRSPDSRIKAERQSLPVPARPCGRVGSFADAKLLRSKLLARPCGHVGSFADAKLLRSKLLARPCGRVGSFADAKLLRSKFLARPCGRVGSFADAKLLAEHSDWRPLAPACRPLPAHSGGTVWDSHPLPGIIGSKAVARQYSTADGHPRTGGAGRMPHRSGPRRLR